MPPHRSPLRLVRLGALLALAWTAPIPTSLGDDAPPDDGLAWRSDYGQALEEARTSDRLLWIQFTGPWCPNCLRMEQDSFPAPAVVARSRSDFVAVKLRADVQEDLALSFGLTGLPATVLVDPSRNVLGVHQGYLGPEDLDGLLGRAVASRAPRHNVEDLADAPRLAREFVGPPEPSQIQIAKVEKPSKIEEHVELSGYCPVSLVAEKRLVEGQAEYAVAHQGRVYKFANLVTFNLFRRDPDRYVPANNGRCPVEQLDQGKEAPGDPRFGALYKGRLYLCASKQDRLRFVGDPDRYATVGVEEQGNCPHCLAEAGVLVPGDPRYSLTMAGRSYWFPDDQHRNAFMSLAPSRTIRR
ncbi:thioredoxin family protein [Planctomyces sp. SH-PL62]|uniref:thioredoxin family protein n=1 Tax=Planctomyces sp. SH-PL62 TaxID=1636152 RepID=UPI00078EC288|nr:thioredoxin family protein [Planctomyces sp. SH-PL62]AMV39448.1 YHS domain protein [Planctomyces sp. SH-PL62]